MTSLRRIAIVGTILLLVLVLPTLDILNAFIGTVLTFRVNENRMTKLVIFDPDQVVRLEEGNFSIHVHWHRPKRRIERFPSVDDRVKLYMSNWYLPPCPSHDTRIGSFAGMFQRIATQRTDDGDGSDGNESSWPMLEVKDPWSNDGPSNKTMTLDSAVIPDHVIFLDRLTIQDCARTPKQYNREGKLPTETRIRRRQSLYSYCSEVVPLMDIMDHLDDDVATPILAFFGDNVAFCDYGLCGRNAFPLPLIAKHRAGTTKEQIAEVTENNDNNCWKESRPVLKTMYHQRQYYNKHSPILWKLEVSRHWNTLPGALRNDIPWEQKRDRAFWGGGLTGRFTGDTDIERCLSNQRCRFVLEHAKSTLIDARITSKLDVALKNATINGIKLTKKKVGVDIIQQYKVIISLEGNDVASGLKWMLQSQSVVLMPPPTRTSWAMEELLEPWVHYIPMFSNGSNAEERVQWALDHERDARRIAERATLFMYDLVYHPDAASDDWKIKEEMARRYRSLWH